MNTLESALHQQYQGQKILILGFGREGQSTYRRLRTCFPDQQLDVMAQDQPDLTKYQDAQLSWQSEYLANLSAYDVIFKTPGISVQAPPLAKFIADGGVITSQLNEFLKLYHDQVIGITGTKGKSTTTSLIFHILQSAARPAVIAGNIGKPVFEVLDEIEPQTQVVIEMSSYQLEAVTSSPHIAVLLNLFPEHLNYHGDLAKYTQAKFQITKFQTAEDVLILNEELEEILAEQPTAAQVQFFQTGDAAVPVKFQKAIEHLPLIVRRFNVPAAVKVATELNISEAEIAHALQTFQTLPHRLEVVARHRDITFIDDTLATIPEATSAALMTLPRVDVVILGGYDRGLDYQPVIETVVQRKVPHVLFFRPSGEKMHQILQTQYAADHQPTVQFVDSMEAAVRAAYQLAPAGGVVLLSPASPSFGQFKDYEDKSRQFVNWVNQLGTESNQAAHETQKT